MMTAAQRFEPRTPNRRLPVPFEMRHPVAGAHQWIPLPDFRKRDLYAVGCGGKTDLLAKGLHPGSLCRAAPKRQGLDEVGYKRRYSPRQPPPSAWISATAAT